jgi:branched-subunit amino acid ABC-type transport system permease component
LGEGLMLALQLAINGILLGGLYVLIAQSLNLIFGVMGIVNLAHGAFIMVAGLFTYWFATKSGLSPLFVLPLAFVAMGLAGALVERFLVEPLMRRERRADLASLMMTFGLSFVLVQLALNLWSPDFVSVPDLQSSYQLLGLNFDAALLISSVFAAAISAALYVWRNYTVSGKSLLAASQSPTGALCCGIDVGRVRLVAFLLTAFFARSGFGLDAMSLNEDKTAAAASGVPATRVKVIAFALSALLPAAAGGLVAWNRSYLDPSSAFDPTLDLETIVFVLFGGIGTLWGPLFGATVLMLVGEELLVTLPHFELALYGLVVILTALAFPGGIVGLCNRFGYLRRPLVLAPAVLPTGEPPQRRPPAARRSWRKRSRCFRCCENAFAREPARFRAVSSRCWRSPAPS